jgi:hypothetical protein
MTYRERLLKLFIIDCVLWVVCVLGACTGHYLVAWFVVAPVVAASSYIGFYRKK